MLVSVPGDLDKKFYWVPVWNSALEFRQISPSVLLMSVPLYTCRSKHFKNVFSTLILDTNSQQEFIKGMSQEVFMKA